jgi:hypothetical protein
MTQEVSELRKKALALPAEATCRFGGLASRKPGRIGFGRQLIFTMEKKRDQSCC